ncbi:hypothetical protein H2201_003156 [Coniosporium apollinis]|uniref:Uncharacterized protein n=1 Tax=Coniosporium apollinis TaxID=61459 RepID=A0ABQ9NWI3_9PEZI|nr:hypothetical protein H2201_003156 [Coniosporium apollinis]
MAPINTTMLLVRATVEEDGQTNYSAVEYASGFIILAAIVGILVLGYALGILRTYWWDRAFAESDYYSSTRLRDLARIMLPRYAGALRKYFSCHRPRPESGVDHGTRLVDLARSGPEPLPGSGVARQDTAPPPPYIAPPAYTPPTWPAPARIVDARAQDSLLYGILFCYLKARERAAKQARIDAEAVLLQRSEYEAVLVEDYMEMEVPAERGESRWRDWTLAVVSVLMFALVAAWCLYEKRPVVPCLEENRGLGSRG